MWKLATYTYWYSNMERVLARWTNGTKYVNVNGDVTWMVSVTVIKATCVLDKVASVFVLS